MHTPTSKITKKILLCRVTAKLNKESKKYEEIYDLFQGELVPLESKEVHKLLTLHVKSKEKGNKYAYFYKVDIKYLEQHQIHNLVNHLINKRKSSRYSYQNALRDLRTHGFYIRQGDLELL